MQDCLKYPLESFDLHGFLSACRDLYGAWSGDADGFAESTSIQEKWGTTPEPNHTGEDIHGLLVDAGMLVFIQLHEPLADTTALCAGGDCVPSEDFDIGVADGYGYVVEVKGGEVHLNPALLDGTSGPCPRIDLQAHCSVLDDRMPKFIQQFVAG